MQNSTNSIKVIGRALPRLSSFIYPLTWLVLLVSAVSISINSLEAYKINKENDLISQLLNGQDITVNEFASALPETRLARAVYLQKQQRQQEALESLSLILSRGDAQFQAKTRYNLGNIYLRQAVSQVETGHSDEAKTLVTLAKQSYREALLRDSGMWDAKYNLEVAMSLLPDFDRINVEESPAEQPKNPLWTAVPGFPRGLP